VSSFSIFKRNARSGRERYKHFASKLTSLKLNSYIFQVQLNVVSFQELQSIWLGKTELNVKIQMVHIYIVGKKHILLMSNAFVVINIY